MVIAPIRNHDSIADTGIDTEGIKDPRTSTLRSTAVIEATVDDTKGKAETRRPRATSKVEGPEVVEGTSKSKSLAGREALKQAAATAGKKHMQTANVSRDAKSDDCTASCARRRSLAALLALFPDRHGRMSEANNDDGQAHRQQKRQKVQGDRRRPDSVATNNDSSSRARGWRTPPPSMTLDGENRSHAKAAPLPLSPTQHVEGLPAMAVVGGHPRDRSGGRNDESAPAEGADGWRTPPPGDKCLFDGANRSCTAAAPLPLSPTRNVEGLPALGVVGGHPYPLLETISSGIDSSEDVPDVWEQMRLEWINDKAEAVESAAAEEKQRG